MKTTASLGLLAGLPPLARIRAATVGADGPSHSRPLRVLYSNDATNLTTCDSPFHKRGEPFGEKMLESAIDEVTGLVDAHFLQPGYGWVPWWKSESYPAAEHYRWYRERYGVKPDGWGRYFLNGGDLAEIFVHRCRLRNQSPFLSLRLNDGHLKEGVVHGDGKRMQHTVSRFYDENWKRWRVGKTMKNWGDRVLNWAIPEVRAHKFQFLKELCAYDIDGLELDFMRDHTLFRLDETSIAQREEIITAFVAQVRAMMDAEGLKKGRRLKLCVRIPAYLKYHEYIGVNLPKLAAAGVDMAVVSSSYFTSQRTDFAQMRALAPQLSLYLEMTHAVSRGARINPEAKGYDDYLDRRSTPELFTTTAHLAYAQGGDGVSYFNFPYYRPYGDVQRGPFTEPPFWVLPLTGDPQRLALLPQYYLWAPGWSPAGVAPFLPYPLSAQNSCKFAMTLAAPGGGWKGAGRFRLQFNKELRDHEFSVVLNGISLTPTGDISELYPTPYTQLLGTPKEMRAWTVPAGLLKNGENHFEITQTAGDARRISYIDLGVIS